jgi:hypothetical protein
MLNVFNRHSRKILIAMLVPVAFGCQPTQLNDLELSERMTKGSSDRPAIITLENGNVVQGFFVALHTDSLEYHEGATMTTRRHAIAIDSVEKVMVNGPTPWWPWVFGLGGCAAGGCAAGCVECTNELATKEVVTTKTVIATGAGAVVGAAAGYGIGLLSDPGRQENAWVYRIRKPHR